MTYSVEFRPAVLKSIKRLPLKDLRRIKKRIDELTVLLMKSMMTVLSYWL
jgi:mRNA-degrading endonuclease RelE of RelBE toxin-antitoxin system